MLSKHVQGPASHTIKGQKPLFIHTFWPLTLDSLFSHASPPTAPRSSSAQLHTDAVVVPVDRAAAFDGFTDVIHLWWPVQEQSHFGLSGHLGFDDHQLVEEADDGRVMLWADIDSWQAPSSLQLAWILGSAADSGKVSVNFDDELGSGTTVTISHETTSADPHPLHNDQRDCDWSLILGRYARFMGACASLD